MKTRIANVIIKSIILFSCVVLIFNSCSTGRGRGSESFKIRKVKHLSARVVDIEGRKITLKLKNPIGIFDHSKKLSHSLARKIIESSYLLKGKSTRVNEHKAVVSHISGEDAVVLLNTENNVFITGQTVKVALEKKTIAITDFEVIVGRNKSVAKYIQEDITTLLVKSDQFHVVERAKLKTILKELELNQSGAIDPLEAKKAGKLLSADVILTGTFAATGEKWNANLRMINTETGLITAAFNKTDMLHDLKSESYRSISNIDGTFDYSNPSNEGWVLGKRRGFITGKGGFQKIFIADTSGAQGTPKSIAMKFRLGSKGFPGKGYMRAQIRNSLKRNLNKYTGIQFYIKTSNEFTVWFQLTDSQKNNKNLEGWFKNINTSKNWKLVKIPFNSLSVMRRMAKKRGTDQILELGRIETIDWKIVEVNEEPGTTGTVWLDQVSFY